MQGRDAPIPDGKRTNRNAFAIGALIHALLILGWWYAAIWKDFDIPLVNGRIWLVGAWAWIAWPIYALLRRRLTRLSVAGLVLGAAVIAPTVSTIYSFSAWAIGGFAP